MIEAQTRPPLDLTLYLVTDPGLTAARGVVETAVAAVKGGATLVQLRDKDASDAALIDIALALKAALAPYGAPLIVNDRVSVALAAGADGVHVGQDDAAAAEARAALGAGKIVGVSVNTEAHARAVDPSVVDYIGCGPIRPTATKGDHKTPIGVAGAAALQAICGLPAVGIGGVDGAAAEEIGRAGLDGAAVVSAICAADDPEAAARRIRNAFELGRRKP